MSTERPPVALVTGAGGFIGARLRRVLAEHGWRVTAVCAHRGVNDGARISTVPLRLSIDATAWRAAMSAVDCVVHLAARVHRMGAEDRRDDLFMEVNARGARFVAEQAAAAGVRRFIYMSSIKVNGEGGERPYRADDAPNPRDSYGCSKLAAEIALKEFCAGAGMDLVIIRPPLVYGPGVKANFARLMKIIDLGLPLPLGAIDNRRSLIGLSNLIDFIETCMIEPATSGKVWLIADDEPVSTPELLRRLSSRMCRPLKLLNVPPVWLRRIASPFGLEGAVDRLCDSLLVDSAPARLQLGWRQKYSMDHELDRTIAEYRNGKHRD